MPQHMLQHTLLRTQLCYAATQCVLQSVLQWQSVPQCCMTRLAARNFFVDSVTEGLQHALQQTCHAATYTARIYIHLLVGGVTEERVVWFPTHTRTEEPVHILQQTLQQL